MPELHFHPHSQRVLLKILQEYSETNQIIIVTHSPMMVNISTIFNVVIVKNIDGFSQISQFSQKITQKEERDIDRFFSVQYRDFLFSRAVLLVEGPTEAGALPVFSRGLEMDFDEIGVSIIPSGKYYNILLRLIRELGFPYLVMCDKDALMNIETSITVGGQRVHTSPIFSNLSKLRLLNKKERQKILEIEGEIVVQTENNTKRRFYADLLFDELRNIVLKKSFFVLSSDFEGVLRSEGYGNMLDTAFDSYKSKVIVGKYIATEIIQSNKKIPDQFRNVITTIASYT